MRSLTLHLCVLISALIQPAFATEFSLTHKAAIAEMLNGAGIVESFLAGLELGLATGAQNATSNPMAMAAQIVERLDERFVRDKLVELYAQHVTEAQAREIIAFEGTHAGQGWKRTELRYIALRRGGRSPEQIGSDMQGFLDPEDLAAIKTFTTQAPAGQALSKARDEVDREMSTLLRPRILALIQELMSRPNPSVKGTGLWPAPYVER
jgi:hypothetical protein